MTLFQIYFLGKYFAITQETFINKKFAIFAVGFILYIFITFIFLIPFYFFRTIENYNYIIATLAIKDISIVGFLVNRRDVFEKNKEDIIVNLGLILTAVLIFLIYKFWISKITLNVKSINNSKGYFLLSRINDYLNVLTFSVSKKNRILHFYIWPLLTMGMITTIASFYSTFIKIKDHTNYFITFITIILLLIFKSNLSFEIFFSITLVIFLFQIGINIIIFSRRRYSTLFGAGVIAIWSLNTYLFLVLLIISICFIFTYVILKRPQSLLFTARLTAPIVFVFSFWISENYRDIAIIIFLCITIIYLLLFYRTHFGIFKDNFFVKKIHLLFPISLLILLYLYAIITLLIKSNFKIDLLWKDWSFVYTTDNNLKLAANIIYYITFAINIIYLIYLLIVRKTILHIKLIFLIIFWVFIIIYNPLVQHIWVSIGFSQQYMNNISIITIYPMLMISVSLIFKKFFKIIKFKFSFKSLKKNKKIIF